LIIETDSNLYAHRSPPLPPVQETSGTALVAKRAKRKKPGQPKGGERPTRQEEERWARLVSNE
jgi:hypothetical protein